MAIVDGWLDWAERHPGPPDKKYSQVNTASLYTPHSMVGFLQGWYSRLFSTDKYYDRVRGVWRYTEYAAASVHGSVLQRDRLDGLAVVIQHYPFQVSCWASGSRYPNVNGISFEYEGGHEPHDEPFTPGQFKAHVKIMQELSVWRGWDLVRPKDDEDKSATLYEHNECVRFGSSPTACPSLRVDWPRSLREAKMPTELEKVTAQRNLLTIQNVIAKAVLTGPEEVESVLKFFNLKLVRRS